MTLTTSNKRITALVIGRAKGVWEEVEQAKDMTVFDHVLVVGKAGIDYPDGIDHWVSFHTMLFERWALLRSKKGYPEALNYWGAIYRRRPGADPPTFDKPISYTRCEGGSSGLVAVMVALNELGAQRVVLAGIPMKAEAGHYDEAGIWKEAGKYFPTWEERFDELNNRVKSMSGRTRDLLGAPNIEWLKS